MFLLKKSAAKWYFKQTDSGHVASIFDYSDLGESFCGEVFPAFPEKVNAPITISNAMIQRMFIVLEGGLVGSD